jgi:VIT1/CCC1 family predicted Fe2+/Mn2+ transporter
LAVNCGSAEARTAKPRDYRAVFCTDGSERLAALATFRKHLVDRIGWLRAAVLGANDGIISTGSLIVSVAAAAAKQNDVLIAVKPEHHY